jgi:hypothetical protein
MFQIHAVARLRGKQPGNRDSIPNRGRDFPIPAARMNVGPTMAPKQRVQGILSARGKRAGREADHSSPCSAKVMAVVKPKLHYSYV